MLGDRPAFQEGGGGLSGCSLRNDAISISSRWSFFATFLTFINLRAISLLYSLQLFPICRGVSHPILSREAHIVGIEITDERFT